MSATFDVTSASVIGSEHMGSSGALLLQQNQDSVAFASDENDGTVLAVVTDGCSAGKHSEVGAKIGASVILAQLRKALKQKPVNSKTAFEELLASVQRQVVAALSRQARLMSVDEKEFAQTLKDYFLFTVVGVYVGSRFTGVFSVGDGVFQLGDEVKTLGPFPNNAPPYLAYNCMPATREQYGDLLSFKTHGWRRTVSVERVAIGSDGCEELLLDDAFNGSFGAFFTDDALFKNKALLGRRLRKRNMPSAEVKLSETTTGWSLDRGFKMGSLGDDTTLVLIRRKKPVARPVPVSQPSTVPVTVQPVAARLPPLPSTPPPAKKSAKIFRLFGGGKDDTFID